MKKIVIVLVAVLCVLGLCACSDKEGSKPAENNEKPVKEVIVEIDEDGNILLPNNGLVKDDELVYKLEDGTTVEIQADSDVTVSGEHKATVSYTKEGEKVEQEVTVYSGSEDELTAVSAAKKPLSWGDPGYGDVEIDGVVYGFDDIRSMDFDTSLKWVEAVYGNQKGYSVEYQDYLGYEIIWIKVHDGMACDELKILDFTITGKKGYIGLYVATPDQFQKIDACGL